MGEVELIALVLGTGVRDRPAAVVASQILAQSGGAAGVGRMLPLELAGIHGVGPARAARLLAAVELGRRALISSADLREPVTNAASAARLLGPGLGNLADEELHGLFLDRRRRVVGRRRLTRGSDAFTVVDPRQIYRDAIGCSAAAVILAHNHPSGDPTPSDQDRDITRRVAHAGRVLGVPLLDHLVIAGSRHVSLADAGELPRWHEPEPPWTMDSASG